MTTSVFNGNILSAKQVILRTGAVLNGRALAQTQVVLDHNTISIPVSGVSSVTGSSGGGGGSYTAPYVATVANTGTTISPIVAYATGTIFNFILPTLLNCLNSGILAIIE